MTAEMEEVARKLKPKRGLEQNPLTGVAEFDLQNTDDVRRMLKIHPATGETVFETKAGGFRHFLKLGRSGVEVVDGGVTITGQNPQFDASLHISSTGSVDVSTTPKRDSG